VWNGDRCRVCGTATVAEAIMLPAFSSPFYLPADLELDSAASLTGTSLFMGSSARWRPEGAPP
jgi:hypothetical protein